jgi:hypothetical protein
MQQQRAEAFHVVNAVVFIVIGRARRKPGLWRHCNHHRLGIFGHNNPNRPFFYVSCTDDDDDDRILFFLLLLSIKIIFIIPTDDSFHTTKDIYDTIITTICKNNSIFNNGIIDSGRLW